MSCLRQVFFILFLSLQALAQPLALSPSLAPQPQTSLAPSLEEEKVFGHPLMTQTQGPPPHGWLRLLQIRENMARHKVVKGTFVQTNHLNHLKRSLVSHGHFVMDAAHGIIWDTRSPFASVTVVGHNFVVQKSGDKTTRMDASGNEIFIRISQTMRALFGQNFETLGDAFALHFVENDKGWTLGLVPKDSAVKNFAKAIVMRGDTVLRQLVLYEKNGNTLCYVLSNHASSSELSADEKALFAP